jgi:single-strand DNA-binding protein
MASDNQITIVGNLTDDPELRYTANGAAVANFRVAYSTRIRDAAGNWTDGDTSFFTINCWRSLAENAAETLTRGSRVVVTGRLKQRSWENQEGEKRTVVEIEADDLGPSLKWATASVTKTSRSSSASSGGDWGAAVRRPSARPPTTRRHPWMPGKPRKPERSSARKKEKDAAWQKKQKRKICIFCKDHIDYVDYKDVIMLRKFVSERGKIRARRVTGNCVQHQRDVATAVKNAREMALLPYSAR